MLDSKQAKAGVVAVGPDVDAIPHNGRLGVGKEIVERAGPGVEARPVGVVLAGVGVSRIVAALYQPVLGQRNGFVQVAGVEERDSTPGRALRKTAWRGKRSHKARRKDKNPLATMSDEGHAASLQGDVSKLSRECRESAMDFCVHAIDCLRMVHEKRLSSKLSFDREEAVAHLRAADAKLAALIDRAGPFTMKLDAWSSPFESLVESILYQQLHGKAAATIHRRVREFFGGAPSPELLLDAPEERLRACGVSGNKIKAMRDLAAKTLDGTVPTHAAIRKMPNEEIIQRLTEVRGIGPWTVEMLLIFRMGRPDVLPVSDYGVRKGFALTFLRLPKTRAVTAADLPKPEAMLRRGEKWKPYRSVASWYMWRACDLGKNTPVAGKA
jgi:DNA-3-methyladenine glycosylase II